MKEFYGKYTPGMSLADLHMHTNRSDGRMTPQQLVDLANRRGLNAIGVADHEVIGPAVEAKDYCLKVGYALEVVIGTEITTEDGHLVGLDLENDIPSGKPAEWTIREIHRRGGIVVVPHPMYKWTRSLTREKILCIAKNPDPEICIDAFEVFDAGVQDNPRTRANKDARKFYLEFGDKLGAPVGCTDGHFYTVGRGLTGYDGPDLRKAIKERKTVALFLDEREQIQVLELAKQMFSSLVLEPTRRLQRYRMRRLNGET